MATTVSFQNESTSIGNHSKKQAEFALGKDGTGKNYIFGVGGGTVRLETNFETKTAGVSWR